MKKIKWVPLAVALLGAAASFATKKSDPCTFSRQYWFDGTNYWEVTGPIGDHYICVGEDGFCTWYKPYPLVPNYYSPCQMGEYTPAYLGEPVTPAKK